jgi:hypothetical protein
MLTWDVSIVLRYLLQLWPISNLSLKDLTIKCVMLLALTTGQRAPLKHGENGLMFLSQQ